MDRYAVGPQIGEGSFGKVFFAKKKSTGEEYAIKRMRGNFSWDGVKNLRELKPFLSLPSHPNVVRLYEIHRETDSLVHFVFEYMPTGCLMDMLEHRIKHNLGPLPDMEVRCLLQQLLAGVQHLHANGVFHRDLKPENVLLAGRVCKLADFSLARGLQEQGPLTSYVSTRWYRAPEVLLMSSKYSSAVDTWGVGCIAAELYKLQPLFPGHDEVEQLCLIFQYLGTPQTAGWKEGAALLHQFPVESWPESKCPPRTELRQWLHHEKRVHNHADDTVLDFLLKLLALDPTKRVNAKQALQHKFFVGIDAAVMNAVMHQQGGSASSHILLGTEVPSVLCEESSSSVNQRSASPKNLVTVSPPPEEVVLLQQRRMHRVVGQATTAMATTPATRLVTDKRYREEPFLSPEASINPYSMYKHRKRRIA